MFTDNALLQYTRELTFAQCVGLMSDVVFRIVPSVGAWYKAHQDEMPVTRQAVYDKLKHLELPTAAGLGGVCRARIGSLLAADALTAVAVAPWLSRARAGREPFGGDGASGEGAPPLSGGRAAWARPGLL